MFGTSSAAKEIQRKFYTFRNEIQIGETVKSTLYKLRPNSVIMGEHKIYKIK